MLAIPASAFALTGAVSSSTPAAAVVSLHAQITPRHPQLGRTTTVTGSVPASEAGHLAIVQTASAKRAAWRYLTDTTIGRGGRFVLRVRLRHSGFVRVIDAATPAGARTVAPSWSVRSAGTIASTPVAVTVSAHLKLRERAHDVLAGQRLRVAGQLDPARAGRNVRLQGHAGRGWRTLATGHTHRGGDFVLRYAASSGLQRRLRVVFGGDRANGATAASAGRVTVYDPSVASWYDDAAGTACGFHAGLGVANKTLPCGTKVRFRYGGRSVTARVDDRGPFVAGRTWDFNQNVAAALGFGGVGTVWATR
jgi:hypothetical protein